MSSRKKSSSECEEAFQKSVGEYKSDVFYLGDMVWRDQPELWEKIQDDWKENAGKIKLSYDITVDIDRTGLQENFKGCCRVLAESEDFVYTDKKRMS